MGLGHVIVLPSRQTPNSVSASEKGWELLSSGAGTSGLSQAVPGAQLHGGQISELRPGSCIFRGQPTQRVILLTGPGITHGVAVNLG